ncbi:MAG: hypothetical protein ABSD38_06905 [Syntrophorhabdales bacterium]|jgi:hypothetical protein
MRNLLILLLVCLLVSCSIPFGKKKTPATTADTEKGQKIEDNKPKPGDIKMVDGVEYIYAKNRRFAQAPYEPEYVWVRKDQYSPGLFDTLTGKADSNMGKQERDELQKRMAKLEEDLKKKNAEPQGGQVVYATVPGGLPAVPYGGSLVPTFAFPSSKMRRRVLVLPLSDQTNYKDEHLDDVATQRLVKRLESTGTIICIDPHTIDLKGGFSSAEAMKVLNRTYGVQAVIKGTVSDVYVSSSRVEGKGDREISTAMSKITLDVYNTETGRILRQLSGRNPVALTRDQGEMSAETVKVKAIDLAIELISEDLLRALLSIDWHARVAAIDHDKIFVDAGRLSGLEKGDILEVYAPGEEIIDKGTNQPIGRTKGNYKGELEVSEVFGIDASWATAKKAADFTPTDLVYLKK